MPELPDVEISKRTFDRTVTGRRVEHARLPESRVLKKSASTIRSALKGQRITGSQRHGKYLLAALDSGRWLVLHFGMTGYLHHYRGDDGAPKHERLRLDLDDGWSLGYSCQRLLGQVDLAADPDSFANERSLGPDALELGAGAFRDRLEGRSGAIKSTLMNQGVLAGLGNVYTDEVLYQAKLHPSTSVDRLDEKTLQSLHRTIGRVLRTAIDRHADPQQVPRSWLLAHRTAGEACPRCSGKVAQITVGGRRGYYCPSCQHED